MCVLRACGEEFDVDAFVATTYLKPCNVYRRGEPLAPKSRPHGRKLTVSGITLDVSNASWERLDDQVVDAEAFLKAHQAEIKRLATFPGVTCLTLDFPVDQRVGRADVCIQCEHFSAPFLSLAGQLGLDIELSIYRTSEDYDPYEKRRSHWPFQ